MFKRLVQSHSRVSYFFLFSLSVFLVGIFVFLVSYITTTGTVLAQNSQVKTRASKVILEVHIASTGLTLLQGVTVDSINGTEMVVSSSWNNVVFKWRVETDESYYGTHHFGTKFLDAKGKNIAITDIHPGDIITVSGNLDTGHTDMPTVKADAVRSSF